MFTLKQRSQRRGLALRGRSESAGVWARMFLPSSHIHFMYRMKAGLAEM